MALSRLAYLTKVPKVLGSGITLSPNHIIGIGLHDKSDKSPLIFVMLPFTMPLPTPDKTDNRGQQAGMAGLCAIEQPARGPLLRAEDAYEKIVLEQIRPF